MNQNMLWQYAKLVVGVGVNVQKGQPVIINTPVESAEFARLLTKAAYEKGAKDVVINWRDDFCERERLLNAADEVFDSVYPWESEKLNTLAKAGAAYIAIAAQNPENLKGVDPERLRRADLARNAAMETFYKMEMNNGFPWCVVSVPIPSWAVKVFPGVPEEEAMEKLWAAIFNTVHISEEGDAVAEWKTHTENLKRRCDVLNEMDLKSVHYKNSLGTDLTVELPENHAWLGGSEFCKAGNEFVANMPTEEVFSAPLKTGVNGVVYAARPLVLKGNVVEGICFEFKDGKIVNATSKTAQDVLISSIDTDENSRYLGEIALVPYESPISQSGITFFNTLFDENASCHFAFGKAYSASIKGGDDMTEEELLAAGINAKAETHVDFMVGTPDLSITGVTRSGKEVVIFKDGNFVF